MPFPQRSVWVRRDAGSSHEVDGEEELLAPPARRRPPPRASAARRATSPVPPARPTERSPCSTSSGASSTVTENGSPGTMVQRADAPRRADVVLGQRQQRQPLGRVGDDDRRDLGAHRPLGLALGPADLAEHGGGDGQDRRVGLVAGRGGVVGARGLAERVGRGPRRPVDRALLPPRPHLLGDEREERGEQPEQRAQGQARARCGPTPPRRRRRRRTPGSSPARGSRRRTTRRSPRCARWPGRSRSGRRRRWPRRRGRPARPASTGRAGSVTSPAVVDPRPSANLRRVEQLDGELAADLELALVEHDVHARAAVGGPVAHAVGAVPGDQLGGVVGRVGRRLRQLLAVGVDDEARDGRVGPREASCS